ncbi:MAG: recombination protein NinB [Methylibium sp.]|nr:recombination protein NinB [Methylibium sp.]
MSKRVFRLVHLQARKGAAQCVAEAPDGYVVTVAEPSRNLDQNALSWVYLTAFSEQLQWPVNGQMVRMSPEEWKDVLSAAFKRETARLAMGIDGGVVMLGQRTSMFSKREFAEWCEFLQSVAAARGVELEHPAEKAVAIPANSGGIEA